MWYNLPQIRADIAEGLVKEGMTQSQAAKKLGVTPAAVSQYLNKKRGQQAVKTKPYLEQVEVAVRKILDGAGSQELQTIVCNCCHIITDETSEESSRKHDKAMQDK